MKYLFLMFVLAIVSNAEANTFTIQKTTTGNSQLCKKLNTAMKTAGNHIINIYGSWYNLDKCGIGVSSRTKNVTINAINASFFSKSTINDVLFYFIQSGVKHSTNITWKGGSIDTSNSHPENYPAMHNVGTALAFLNLGNLLIDGIEINGGVNTNIPRTGVNTYGNGYAYANGGDCGICGNDNAYIEIKNSTLKGMSDAAIYLGGGNSSFSFDDGGKIYVHDNILTSNNIGVILKRQAKDVDVRNNLFIRNGSGVIANKLNGLDSARKIQVVNNTFIKHVSSAISLTSTTNSAITYGNKIYGIGRVGGNMQNSNVSAIYYNQTKQFGMIRMNTIHPKSIPSSIAFKGKNYYETYIPPSVDSTTAVKVLSNSGTLSITANNISDTRIGLFLNNTKSIYFNGNISNAIFGILLAGNTVGSKIKAGIFSSYVGLREYIPTFNKQANPKNRFCALRDDTSNGAIWVQAGSTTESTIRIGWSNTYKKYIGQQRVSNVNSCGF